MAFKIQGQINQKLTGKKDKKKKKLFSFPLMATYSFFNYESVLLLPISFSEKYSKGHLSYKSIRNIERANTDGKQECRIESM